MILRLLAAEDPFDGRVAAVADTRELISTLDRHCHDLLVTEVESYPG